MKTALITAAVLALAGAASAQQPQLPVAGRWQGTVKSGSDTLRMVVRLEERAPGRWTCFVNFIERQPDPLRCASFTSEAGRIVFSVTEARGVFTGVLADRGQTLAGTWTSPAGGVQSLRLSRTPEAAAWPLDTAAHKQIFVKASDGTFLEVVDWGGEGPAVIFTPGLGGTAHGFDTFAPRLTSTHHVYGVTRRGYGASDRPAPTPANYGSRRLGDDILDVMNALKLDRAVLVGWSAGGIELSSAATRAPERVAGLVYLDAAYAYSFYAAGNMIPVGTNLDIAVNDLAARVASTRGMRPAEAAEVMDQILRIALPDLATDVVAMRDRFRETAAQQAAAQPSTPQSPAAPTPVMPAATIPTTEAVSQTITRSVERFAPLRVPVLALYAEADTPPPTATPAQVAMATRGLRNKREQVDRFKAAHPQARVLELKDADHAIFRSNPDEVLREMQTFLAGLPK